MNKSSIAIIGAGYTGLVAALKLAEQGNRVTILENSKSVGGLASDFKIEGSSLERAYHHIFKTDTDIINLSEKLGIKDKLIWHDSSVSLYYENHLYPFKGAMDLLKFKPLNIFDRLRAGFVVLYLQKTRSWKRFEDITAYDWMLKNAGKNVTKVIWEPLLKGKFDKYYDKVSMAWLWARINVRAQSRESGGEKLGYFDGGFQTFTDALIDKLKSLGVRIVIDSKIKNIKSAKNSKVSIHFNNNKNELYDACVATVPSYVFAKLVNSNKNVASAYLNKLNSIKYLGARIFIFSSTQNISKYYWHNINDLKLPFLVFINHTKLINKKHYNDKYIYYIATYVTHEHHLFTCDDEELEKLWFGNLKKIFPQFQSGLVREKHFFRFANAQHIVTKKYSTKIPDHQSPLNNVYLANFSQIYPEDRGTNYAVREGLNIADLLINNSKAKN